MSVVNDACVEREPVLSFHCVPQFQGNCKPKGTEAGNFWKWLNQLELTNVKTITSQYVLWPIWKGQNLLYSSSFFIIYISKKLPDLKECGQDERDRGEMGSGSASANGHLPLCPPLLSLIAPCHAHAWALTAVSDAQNPGQAAAQNFVLPRQGKA